MSVCCTVIRQSCNLHTVYTYGEAVLKIGTRGIRVCLSLTCMKYALNALAR